MPLPMFLVPSKEHLEDQETNALVSRLLAQKKKESLQARLTTPPPPLIERIAPAYEPPAPIPEKLHFRQKKITARVEEAKPLFEAVKERFDPVFAILNHKEGTEWTGLPDGDLHKLWAWWGKFQDYYGELDENLKWSNTKWRHMFGALKQLRKINTSSPEERFDVILDDLLKSKHYWP